MSSQKFAESDRSIQSVARALQILKYIAAQGNSAGLTTISGDLGLCNSTTHGLLATLKTNGFVQQEEVNGKYSLGISLFELGQTVKQSMDVRKISLPYLKSLVKKYNETMHLGILEQHEIVYIEKVESPQSIRMLSQVGGRHPAHCTGIGKVLLAELSDNVLKDFFRERELLGFTQNTITNFNELLNHLAKIRVDGYALDEEEIEAGLRCVAVPLKDYKSCAVAALSMCIPVNRLAKHDFAAIIRDLKIAALEISRKLGYLH